MRSVKCSLTEYSKSLYDRGKKGQKAAVAVANKIMNIGYALCKSRSTYSYEGCETELRGNSKAMVWKPLRVRTPILLQRSPDQLTKT